MSFNKNNKLSLGELPWAFKATKISELFKASKNSERIFERANEIEAMKQGRNFPKSTIKKRGFLKPPSETPNYYRET